MFEKFNTSGFKRYVLIIGGSLLYALSVTLFVTPMGYFTSGLVGTSQVIRSAIQTYTSLNLPVSIDIAGLINLMFNIPLFILAYTSISRKVFFRTIVSLAVQTIVFTWVPSPEVPLIEDALTACLIGGILSGVGIGLVLQASATAGGMDILGFFLTLRIKNFSIGKVTLTYNAILYIVCAILFDVETAIYSIIYMVVYSMVMDKTHLQNIKSQVTVFTDCAEMPKRVTKEISRGVTILDGVSAFTGEHKVVFTTVASKYEVMTIRHIIHEMDPTAFMIVNEGVNVRGNYLSHL